MSNIEAFSFDLLSEPWIPCERVDGTRDVIGIERALLEAQGIAALHDESPLATAMIHRVLLAILHRVFAPRSMEDWEALWATGKFDREKVTAYFRSWRGRFDLFHPERPFLQVARLGEILASERGKEPNRNLAWRLPLETSSHSYPANLFEAVPDASFLRPAEAIRGLLGFYGFSPGGRIENETDSWPGGNLRVGAVVLARGATLFQTLLLNLVWAQNRTEDDLPPWERASPTQRETRASFGLVDQLIWTHRRVCLLPTMDGDGHIIVTEVVTAAGSRLDPPVNDAMFGYVVRNPKNPPVPIRIDRDRSSWRDADALFEAGTEEGFRRPTALDQVSSLVYEGIIARAARLDVEFLGLSSNKAAIRLWRAERMPLPVSLLVDPPRVGALRLAIDLAEQLGDATERTVLFHLCENALAPTSREAHKDDIGRLRESLGTMPAFWSELGLAFPAWLHELGSSDDLEATLEKWKRTLERVTRAVVLDAIERLGDNARALQAGAKAERSLYRVLGEILSIPRVSATDQSTSAISLTEGASIE